MTTELRNLALTVRAVNCLRAENLNTIGDVVNYHAQHGLLKIPNLGRRGFNEIKDAFASVGVQLE